MENILNSWTELILYYVFTDRCLLVGKGDTNKTIFKVLLSKNKDITNIVFKACGFGFKI